MSSKNRWGLAGGKLHLVADSTAGMPEPPDADDLAFAESYEAWKLRFRIKLPAEQLRIICRVWFNLGSKSRDGEIDRLRADLLDLQHDCASLMTETTDDDGLSEYERLGEIG